MAYDLLQHSGLRPEPSVYYFVNMRSQLTELPLTLYKIREHCVIMRSVVLAMKGKADTTGLGLAY